MSRFFKVHLLAIIFAVSVGVLYIAPHLVFIFSLGDDYKGIPIMQTANEDEYLLRIQEIIDGHWGLGSPLFFEYKDQPPLSPPAGEFFYAVPAMVFGTSAVNILIASRFYLPLILFLLVYFLIWKLTREPVSVSGKMNAVVGAIFVTLGYDLVDYGWVLGLLSGKNILAGNLLIWSRPVNPILGAIFLFSFLILVWGVIQNTKKIKSAIFFASVFLALMIGSYFFSWGIAAAVLAVLILIYLFKKEYAISFKLALIFPLGFLFSAPYWYAAWRAASSPWYQESVLRSGLFLTHYPLFNKLLIAALIFYAILFLFFREKFKQGLNLSGWHWFSLALVFGGLLAYNQQILTGRTIWPYHFVQYTIPLAMVIFMTLLYNIIREKNKYVWKVFVSVIAVSSLSLGAYTQLNALNKSYSRYIPLQRYASLFDWLNSQKNGCVVLEIGEGKEFDNFDNYIPAFTHCDLYDSKWVFSLMPEERIYHNYFTRLFLNGITPENIEEYIARNPGEVGSRLFTNFKELFNVKDFPDFKDGGLEKRFVELADKYKEFFKKNIISELKKYRLDYILINGKITRQESDLVNAFEKVYETDDFIIYR